MAQRALAGLIAALMLALVLLNVANVVGRRLLGQAIPSADELMTFGMIWLVFLGVILVTGDDRHLSFDIAAKLLPARGRLALAALLDLALAAVAAYVAVQSFAYLDRLAGIGQRSMAAGIPMVVPHAAVLAGLAATALLAGVRAVSRLQRLTQPPAAAR
ncbi:MAG: TRAP transporter small permease [Alphaproteobacteria bacterium]